MTSLKIVILISATKFKSWKEYRMWTFIRDNPFAGGHDFLTQCLVLLLAFHVSILCRDAFPSVKLAARASKQI